MLYATVPESLQSNKIQPDDAAGHDWYRFVLSYPPHLVKYYLDRFDLSAGASVLDPFSGTGTTVLEAVKNGYRGLGVEANPVAHLASTTKLDWKVDSSKLLRSAESIAKRLERNFREAGIRDEDESTKEVNWFELKKLPPVSHKLLLKDSINPVSLHKSLCLIELIQRTNLDIRNHLLVAAVTTIVNDVSNLKFGPEVGVRRVKSDKPILVPWLARVRRMAQDLTELKASDKTTEGKIVLGDARLVDTYFPKNSVDAIITSPPYPNEKDYSRTTRLENVLLGFVGNMQEQRKVKKRFVRSNTRSVYKDDQDHLFVKDIDSIQKVARKIEERRIELGKTSGFEKLYHKVTLQYFGGMARHLAACKTVLRPGSKLAYVVGDQASYLRIMIRTGHLLAEVAESMGYTVDDIELFRTRFATRSKEELREEVLILTYNG